MIKKLEQQNNNLPKLLIIGFGSIGQATLPLVFKYTNFAADQILIISKDNDGMEIAKKFSVAMEVTTITSENYANILKNFLNSGDFLLNLSVGVSSIALIEWCQNQGVLYLDTCTEPWEGGYTDQNLPPNLRTNYALREEVLKLKKKKSATAVITHGANPGLVSHFLKQALLNIADDNNLEIDIPQNREQWGILAKQLNIKTIQIAEQDTQVTGQTKNPDEFVNTWSVDGFISEGLQPAELGWGSHEQKLPKNSSQHTFGSKCSIYLNRPGASVKVRSWTPLLGSAHGFMITHAESISIANFLTLANNSEIIYRPTVHYAYLPCPDAILSLHELAGNEWCQQKKSRIIMEEIIDGVDALGVLLLGNKKGAYWYGSQLSIQEARKLAPFNNATSLQVAIGVVAGMCWAINNPNEGLLEPEEIDHEFILNFSRPYLGNLAGFYSDWTPLMNRGELFDESLNQEDPFQFSNIIC